MGRKYYIPITRSGSSMLASVLTQTIDNSRRVRSAKLSRQLANKEISPIWYFCCRHPIFSIWVVLVVLLSLFRY